MKINIELEILPDEVDLATELIATLRSLTSHVAVKQAGSAPSGAGFMASGGLASLQALPPGPQVPGPGQLVSAAPGTAAGQIPIPSPAPRSHAEGYSASPEAFLPLLGRLLDVPGMDSVSQQQCIEQVGADLKSVFARSAAPTEELISAFLQAFSGLVFSAELTHRQQPLLPFMELLQLLPETAYATVRDRLISTVLKHLTVKRALDADRTEFLAYAEAFAALIKLGTVSISGSVTTMITLMNKPENRCAAVTMLGKTCELCGHVLLQKCSEAELGKLREAVEMIAAEGGVTFQYDIAYIKGVLGWDSANGGS
uniref:Wd40 repeat-like protein n=1 Tax=Tetraselmis sp. GSL018 TaxID=582737 RepID=A0A061SC15_9CHLO|eukprot:CAMPEP_0177615170 /NCGR_PEP_ID=MMETSP0419_2-20121207/23244_1 /TAXON_ID=582737 /ORGANISM="Tetraselmis sp., Strain GSL018" /LENGTH=312 /DNA_ID=CAMNT_0019112673 /DNA_START=222 /DNA_END=1160 /DNA_ORIENTATION=+